MTSTVGHVAPVRGSSSRAVEAPIPSPELFGKLTVSEPFTPPSKGVFVQVAHEDVVQLAIAQVTLYFLPVAHGVVVMNALRHLRQHIARYTSEICSPPILLDTREAPQCLCRGRLGCSTRKDPFSASFAIISVNSSSVMVVSCRF